MSSRRRTLSLPFRDDPHERLPLSSGSNTDSEPLEESLDNILRILEAEKPTGELKIHYVDTVSSNRANVLLKLIHYNELGDRKTGQLIDKLRGVEGLRGFEQWNPGKDRSPPVLFITFSLADSEAPNPLEWGAWWESAEGTACGDLWASVEHGRSTTFLVSDGVGRGRSARDASQRAAEVLRTAGNESPDRLIEIMHNDLRSTAGAVVFAGRYSPSRATLEFCSVGNISAYRIGADSITKLIALNGTVGYRLPKVRVFEKEFERHTGLVLHTDGLNVGYLQREDLSPRTPSMCASVLLEEYGGKNDDALAAVLSVV